MARTIAQIKQSILDEKALHAELNGLNSPSQTAIYNLWIYITAVALFIHETLWDKFKIEIETTIANQPVGTVKWVQQKCFDFQYDALNPQIVQLVNFVPQYNPIDDTKKIVTRCSVKTQPNKVVSVKVAKAEPPTPLTNMELSSLQGYLDTISFAGVQYATTSLPPDYMYLDAEIFYNGQYAAVISASTITAINNYLANIPFDGVVRDSALVDAIQQVPGVTDVVIKDLALRANATAFGMKTYLIQNKQTIFNKYPLTAGYVIGETNPNDFATKLTFTVEA